MGRAAVAKTPKRQKVTFAGTVQGRPTGSATQTVDASRFKSALELGFDGEFVRAVSAALNLLGPEQKLRFVTFAQTADAPFNHSEARLPVELVKIGRQQAKTLGEYSVYFPRTLRNTSLIIDDEGVKWLRRQGYATRTIGDVYHASTTLLYRIIRNVPAGTAVEQKRRITEGDVHDTKAYQAGVAWMLGAVLPNQQLDAQPLTLVELNEQIGPGRILRCGEALLAFRAHFKRDPKRVAPARK